ncbi:MAG: hypothetical protein AAGA10_01560 [Bacteroidota bacterium]
MFKVNSNLLLFCTAFLCTLTPILLRGQDMIYTLDEKILYGTVKSVGKKIGYTQPENPNGPIYTLKAKKVAFIVYQDGNLDVIGKKSVRNIPFAHSGYDILLTLDKRMVPMDSLRNNGNEVSGVSLADPSHPETKFRKDFVVAKWDRYKSLNTYAPFEKVRDVLFEATSVGAVYPIPKEKDPSLSQGRQTVDEPKPIPESTNVRPTVPKMETSSTEEELPFDQKEFEGKATAKVKRLQNYFQIISNKKSPVRVAENAVLEALVLFVSDTSFVQVSSVNKPNIKPKQVYIRQYLENLKAFLYDRVEIKWIDVYFVSKLVKNPGGDYEGVVSFVQVFEGYRDGRAVYRDKTTKNIRIILKRYEKFENGIGEELWDVLLSDISVESTERI